MNSSLIKKPFFLSIYSFGTAIIVFSYIYAFFTQEDASGGGKLDFENHIYNNYLLFFNFKITEINWNYYDSTSLPLHYIFSKLFFYSDHNFLYRLFWFIFSFLGPVLVFLILNRSFQFNNFSKLEKVFLSSIILLSPYYRSSSIWGLEENIGIVCLLFSLLFFKIYSSNKSNFNLILLIIFTCLTFLSRQSYLFLSLIIFFSIINKSKLFEKKNFLITIYFLLFSTPSVYFFYVWQGLVPPMAGNRNNLLDINNLPTILNIILIYILPFIFVYFKNSKILITIPKIILSIFIYVIFLIIFSDYNWTNNGSGALPKLLSLFISNNEISRIILITFSFISLIFIYMISRGQIILQWFFIINILIFLNIDVIFHEYFDPLTLIFLLIFGSSKIITYNKIKIHMLLAPYLAIFLLSSVMYH